MKALLIGSVIAFSVCIVLIVFLIFNLFSNEKKFFNKEKKLEKKISYYIDVLKYRSGESGESVGFDFGEDKHEKKQKPMTLYRKGSKK